MTTRIGCAALERLRGDRGAVTAEFVVLLPALLAVMLCAVGVVLFAAHRVALTAAAAELARLEARGDNASAQARLADLGRSVSIARVRDAPLLCVTLRSRPGAGAFAVVEVEARACAAIADAED